MVSEILKFLSDTADSINVDCTVGEGGHTEALLKKVRGRVIGLDIDPDILTIARKRLSKFANFTPVRASFTDLRRSLDGLGVGNVDNILYDFGISTFHLTRGARGFSFHNGQKLDMRFNPTAGGVTAGDIVNRYSQRELTRSSFTYGEERFAPRIANAIVRERRREPIVTARSLADIIRRAVPRGKDGRPQRIDPATRSFQALRITVNDELGRIEETLAQAFRSLKVGGRMLAISFHSLEDRLVKTVFKNWQRGCDCPPTVPVCNCNRVKLAQMLTKKPVVPTAKEIAENPASRSAKLRVVEKLREGTIH